MKVMPMEQPDTELLARHLGHDEKTHKAYYRRSIAVVQLSKVWIQMIVIYVIPVVCIITKINTKYLNGKPHIAINIHMKTYIRTLVALFLQNLD